MIDANSSSHRLLPFAFLAMSTAVFLVNLPAAFADSAASVSPSVRANDQPPFTADQIRKLQNLINGKDGHDEQVPKDVQSAFGLSLNGTLRSFTLDVGKKGAYEISILPNNFGYLIVRQDDTSSRILRLDADFILVSAITKTGPGAVTAMPVSDTNKFYSEEIPIWRKIIDKFGSP